MNMLWHFLRPALSMLSAALLIACATAPAPQEQAPEAAQWPPFSGPAPDETVFRVDRLASQVRIRVDPAGPMARLGHSHVVGGPVISGIIVIGNDNADSRFDLSIDATALEVDRPEWRRAQDLEPELDASAIQGTRDNMRSARVLDVARHPEIAIRSTAIKGPDWLPTVTLRIRLRGEVRELAVPVAVERAGPRIVASGQFDLRQSDFGIQPFSTAGGALRVADRMRIRFRIVARNRSDTGASRPGQAGRCCYHARFVRAQDSTP